MVKQLFVQHDWNYCSKLTLEVIMLCLCIHMFFYQLEFGVISSNSICQHIQRNTANTIVLIQKVLLVWDQEDFANFLVPDQESEIKSPGKSPGHFRIQSEVPAYNLYQGLLKNQLPLLKNTHVFPVMEIGDNQRSDDNEIYAPLINASLYLNFGTFNSLAQV